MNSEKNGDIINISAKKRSIASSKTEFVSNDIQISSPKSDSNFVTSENEINLTDKSIKKEDKQIKRKVNQNKPITKYKTNRIVRNKDIDNKKNEEIYFYFNKSNVKIINNFEQNQILNFLVTRLDKDKTLKCNILLKNNNFILYSNTKKFILSAKEQFSIFHKNFLIYSTRDFLDNSIIASLHSYQQKSEFILYDIGVNPAKLKSEGIDKNNENQLRRYLLQVKFLNDKKFEHFLVYLPKENYFTNNNYNKDENHKDKLSNNEYKNIDIYESNLPKFDFSLHKFVDNFSSRVKEKSKFNFKILNEGQRAIECGKVNEYNYILDISYPFSPLEAFSIALSFFIKNK